IAYDNTGDGIYLLQSCDNNSVSGNIAYGNGDSGIHLLNLCNNNLIARNNASNNGCAYGIWLDSNSDNNTILGNIASSALTANQTIGIFLSSLCDNNNLSENTLKGNSQYGICLTINCSDNKLMENHVLYNLQCGLVIETHCNNNIIYLNEFRNQFNARNDGNNQWDNGTIGNYWGDYQGVDKNDDGIGDTPYMIAGTANSIDYFPIWNDGIDIHYLFIDMIDQIFSKASFNITFYIYGDKHEEIDFAAIQMQWDGVDVSSDVQNLGGGFYFISLNPITVLHGEDPILLSLNFSAPGFEGGHFETNIAVDPSTLQKGTGGPSGELWMIIIIILSISLIAVITLVSFWLRRRRISQNI
ncbi:MAG: nitrous oxide reductase family maturation protein NosD, partial [Promethearchaeota archaeon]